MTILLEILLVAAVVFGAVAYATGRVEGMAPAPPDTGEVGLPEGEVDAAAIDRTRFGLAFRGYRMAEVDAVLDRLRDEMARRDALAAGSTLEDGASHTGPGDLQPEVAESSVEAADRPAGDAVGAHLRPAADAAGSTTGSVQQEQELPDA